MSEACTDYGPSDGTVVATLQRPLKRSCPSGQVRDQGSVKRRSSSACTTCRARKVRCDINVHGIPCTNCRLDSVECLVVIRKRGPKSRCAGRQQPEMNGVGHEEAFAPSNCDRICEEEETEQVDVALMTPTSSPREHEATGNAQPHHADVERPAAFNLRTNSIFEVAVGLTFDHDETEKNDRELQGDGETVTSGGRANTGPSPSRSDHSNSHGSRHETLLFQDESALPNFILPLPTTLGDEDIAFLERKGALKTPTPVVRDQIIRSYLCFIHPFMPIIDVHEFLTVIFSDGQSGRISILLFQAIMFAGLSGLEPQVVRDMGFEDIKRARQSFFLRVRLLHDLDVEQNDTALLQTLLLMSLYYGGPNQPRNTWYYTGLALSLAQCMGLHHEPDRTKRDWQLRRRLWWSLLMRDRLIALGTRRPMRVLDADHELAMLSVADFDRRPLTTGLAQSIDPCGLLPTGGETGCLAQMCVELSKLCICIGNVLTSQYTVFGRRSPWSRSLMVVPRQNPDVSALAEEIDRLHSSITALHEDMAPEVAKITSTSSDQNSDTACVRQHATILEMVRLSLISLLYRPHSLRALPKDVSDADRPAVEFFRKSKTRLKATARDLTRIIQTMLQQDTIRYLPTSGTPILLSASMTHLLDLDAEDDDVRDASVYRLQLIMQAFAQLRQVYASADSAVTYLGVVIRTTGLGARQQIAALAPEFDPSVAIACSSRDARTRSSRAATSDTGGSERQREICPHKVHGTTNISSTSNELQHQEIFRQCESLQVAGGRQTSTATRPYSTNLAGPSQYAPATTADVSTTNFNTLASGSTGLSDPRPGHSLLNSMLSFESSMNSLGTLDFDVGPELFGAQYDLFGADFSWFANANESTTGLLCSAT